MGDIGFKETFASITTDALLNALMVVILASLVIMLVQKLLPALAGKLGASSGFTCWRQYRCCGY